MLRLTAALLAVSTLTGCVTERIVYRDRYPDTATYERSYAGDGSYRESRPVGSGTYYSPSYSGSGDYYYGSASYATGYGYESPSWYWDYPAYYSVFWPMYRSWYDPYWYPNYYYGVTYYPRSYFSLSINSGWGWPRYSNWYYSPYRHSWVDNYYDWSPWHGHSSHYPNRYQTPRYGSARNEAERLSRQSDWNANSYGGHGASGYGYGRYDRNRDDTRDTAFGRYGTTRSGVRGADYGSQPAPRQLPNERGVGVQQSQGDRYYGRSGDVRRNAGYGSADGGNRQDPGVRGFGVPVDSRAQPQREASYGAQAPRSLPATRGFGVPTESQPRYSAPGESVSGARGYDRTSPSAAREATRYNSVPRGSYDTGVTLPRRSQPVGGYQRSYSPAAAPTTREVSRPSLPSRSYEAPQPEYRSAPREAYAPQPSRSYSPPSRGYDAGNSAPAPRFESRSEPSYQPRSEPRFESRPEPRFESRPEPRSESRSDSDDGGGVRRVGSSRDEN